LFDAVPIDSRADLRARESPYDPILSVDLGIPFEERQRFVKDARNIFFRKLVCFFARVVQELCNDLVQTFRFPAHDSYKVLLVLLQRNHAGEFLDSSRHRRQWLADFVRDGRRETSQRRHPLFRGHFLFEML